MHIFKQIGHMKAYLKEQRANNLSIGLVPTMGALHPGHLSLLNASKKKNSLTICSIYVNPAQFNNMGDLEKYPRTLEKDIQLLRDVECDAVFCPDNGEMYANAYHLAFDFGPLDKMLEGEFRPGHFSGVALVVSKLFNIIQPDRAYFGQKDFQQFKVVSRLVEEMKFNLTIECIPIVREEDGLAMSSRNMRLTSEERKRSLVLYRSLVMTRDKLLAGESFAKIKKEVENHCNQHRVSLEYLALADCEDFALLEKVIDPHRAMLLIAAWVGEVRLIDNLFLLGNETKD